MIDEETTQSPLYDVLQFILEEALLDLCTQAPARVETYDAARQKVSVTVMVKQAHRDETGARVVETLPIIVEMPVMFRSGGGFAETFPIARGDTGVAFFAQCSLDVWATQGGIVDPLNDRRHSLSDGMFYPGLRSFNAPLSTCPTDRARFGKDGDGPALEVTSTAVLVGGGLVASHEPTLKATTYRTAESTLMAAFNAYIAAIAAIADPSGTATSTLTAAINAFAAAGSTYLTTIAKVR